MRLFTFERRVVVQQLFTGHHHGPAHRGRRHETSGAGPATAREALQQLLLIRTAHPECQVLFIPGGCTAASRHRASEAPHQTAGHAILCRVRVPERCGA